MSARSLVPPAFLFRYSFPIARKDDVPRRGKELLSLPASCALPAPGGISGQAVFAELRLAWNPGGLAIAALVDSGGRSRRFDAARPDESDGLQVWIDTRNTQSIHRASRFCHWLCLLPGGFGPKRDQPGAAALAIPRARDDASVPDVGPVKVATAATADGYRMEAWIPGETLVGWDPESNPKLGFYALVRDAARGEQPLTVGREFPFPADPSLWSTLELQPFRGVAVADPSGGTP